MIHDVSTDTADPPQFIALREARLNCRNGIEYSCGTRSHANIGSQFFAQSREQVFQAALAVARRLQWQIAAAVESEGRIEATVTTRLLRFKDDVVIRIRASADGTRLDMRSASRIGRSDLGANARRIRAFLLDLKNTIKSNT